MFGRHTEHLYYLIMRDLTQGPIIGHLLRLAAFMTIIFWAISPFGAAPATN